MKIITLLNYFYCVSLSKIQKSSYKTHSAAAVCAQKVVSNLLSNINDEMFANVNN